MAYGVMPGDGIQDDRDAERRAYDGERKQSKGADHVDGRAGFADKVDKKQRAAQRQG